MSTFGVTSIISLAQRRGYKRLLMSPLWVIAFAAIVAMDCSGPGRIFVDEANYFDHIQLATDHNGHVLVAYESESRKNIITSNPRPSDLERTSHSLGSFTYDFASGDGTGTSIIKQVEIEDDFISDFHMNMAPSGLVVASWTRSTEVRDVDSAALNQTVSEDFNGASFNINQSESTWSDSSLLNSMDGLANGRNYGMEMGVGNVAMFVGDTIDWGGREDFGEPDMLGLFEKEKIYARWFDGSRWTSDVFKPDIGSSLLPFTFEQPPQFNFNAPDGASIFWVEGDSLYVNRFTIGNPLNEAVNQLDSIDSDFVVITDTAVAGDFSGHEIVVLRDDTHLYSQYYDGRNWGPMRVLGRYFPDFFKQQPGSVVIDNTGSAIFVFSDASLGDGPVKVRHFTPGIGWGDEQNIGSGGLAKISMNVQGEAVLVWVEDSDFHSARYSPQNGWQADVVISNKILSSHIISNSIIPAIPGRKFKNHDVIIDNNGNALAAWIESIRPDAGPIHGTRIVLHDYTRATLDVTVIGNGQVSSSPSGIDCQATASCSAQYLIGETVTLAAVANPGATFTGWSGDCTVSNASTNEASVTLDANRSCTASFDALIISYPLVVNKVGSGAVTGIVGGVPTGINCGIDCEFSYLSDTRVTLTATPASGYQFFSWGGDCTNLMENSVEVVMDGAKTCSATFTAIDPVTLEILVLGNGTVNEATAPLQCVSDSTSAQSLCSQDYATGETITLTTTPGAESMWTSWGGCDSIDANSASCTLQLNSAHQVIAQFDPVAAQTAQLTVSKAGTGDGVVSSNPAGINCDADCDESYNLGATVTLSATAEANSVFAGWSGDAVCTQNTNANSTTVTINADLNCIATFDPVPTALLTVSKAGLGDGAVNSNPAGISCGVDCNDPYSIGASVTLTAVADSNSVFAGWSGDVVCTQNTTANSTTVTINADLSCIATFDPAPTALLTVSKAGLGDGTVSSNPAGINCGVDCNDPYSIGASVTLTAVADINSVFAGWSGDAVCTQNTAANSTTVTINADLNCIATFDPVPTALLTVSKAGLGDGAISSNPAGISCGADCNETYNINSNVVLTAAPDINSVFAGWSGDAVCSQNTAANSTTVTINADLSCIATFDPAPTALLTVSKVGLGDGVISSVTPGINCGVDCDETSNLGSVVVITASADSNSVFSGWSGDTVCSQNATGNTTGVLINSNTNCIATFNLLSQTALLTVGKVGLGNGVITSFPAGINCGADCDEAYPIGSNVTISAVADSSSVFTSWSGDAVCAQNAVGIATTVPLNSNVDCFANFDIAPIQTFQLLTVITAGTGGGVISSNPAGIDCGAVCSDSFATDSNVTLRVVPDPGFMVASWSGGCFPENSDQTLAVVTMEVDTTCTVTFAPVTISTLTVTASGLGNIISTPAGIDTLNSDFMESYTSSTNVGLTALAGTGNVFTDWSCLNDTTAVVTTFTTPTIAIFVDDDFTCTATFAAPINPVVLTLTLLGDQVTVSEGIANLQCIHAGGATPTICNASYSSGTSIVLQPSNLSGASSRTDWQTLCDSFIPPVGLVRACQLTLSADTDVRLLVR